MTEVNLQIKFQVYATKYNYSAEQTQRDKSIHTNQRKFVALARLVLANAITKLLTTWKWKIWPMIG